MVSVSVSSRCFLCDDVQFVPFFLMSCFPLFSLFASGFLPYIYIRYVRRSLGYMYVRRSAPCLVLSSRNSYLKVRRNDRTTTMLGLSASVAADDVCTRCVSGFVLKGERQELGPQAALVGLVRFGPERSGPICVRASADTNRPLGGRRRHRGCL